MSQPGLSLERLAAHHQTATFRSGHPAIDNWLSHHGLAAQQMDSARTFVLVRDGAVIGYFSLTMGSVLREVAPPKLVRGLPRYPVGVVVLARLAVELSEQGRGLGAILLAEALRKAVLAGEAAAAGLVVVDAVDDRAVDFYLGHGFLLAPEQDRRLYRRMKDIRASLA